VQYNIFANDSNVGYIVFLRLLVVAVEWAVVQLVEALGQMSLSLGVAHAVSFAMFVIGTFEFQTVEMSLDKLVDLGY